MNPTQNTQPSIVTPNTLNQTPSTGKKMSKKTVFAIVALLVLVVGTGAGAVLIGNPITYFSRAWDCGKYVFSVSQEGIVTATNGSTKDQPFQRAVVYINNIEAQTFDVPALTAGSSATVGVVTVPDTSYSWQVQGTSDCQNAGRYDVTASYQCQQIMAEDENGNNLSSSDLSNLKDGDKVVFVAKGSGTTANYQAVRFSINGTQMSESTQKTSGGDYSYTYTIPTGTDSFSVTAQLKAKDNNWY